MFYVLRLSVKHLVVTVLLFLFENVIAKWEQESQWEPNVI